jgi:RND family efflux transporter MFP subunit
VVSFVGGGRLLQRTVEAGDAVVKGQVIARNDAEPIRNAHKTLRAQVHSLTTQRDQLTRDVSRVDQLRAQGAASVQQQEQLQSQLTMVGASLVATEAQLQDAQRQLDEAVLRAPFDGVVTDALAHEGEVLAPGQPVVRVAAPGGTDVEVRVPESLVTSLRTDTPVEVRFPLASATAKSATITAIASSAVTGQTLYPVRIALTDTSHVRSGMTAEVSFRIPEGSRVLVPADAIVAPTRRGSWVLVVDEADRIRSIPVTIEGASDDGIVVQGALRDGERVVVGAPAGLVAGTQVSVASDTSDASAASRTLGTP